MGGEIVARDFGRLTRQAGAQHRFEPRPIDRSGMVVVEPSAPGHGQMRAIAVKIVQRQAFGVSSQRPLELVRQPGLAGAAATHDRHQERLAGVGLRRLSRLPMPADRAPTLILFVQFRLWVLAARWFEATTPGQA